MRGSSFTSFTTAATLLSFEALFGCPFGLSVLFPLFLSFEFTVPSFDCGIWRNIDPYHFLQIFGDNVDQVTVLQRCEISLSACCSPPLLKHMRKVTWHLAISWSKSIMMSSLKVRKFKSWPYQLHIILYGEHVQQSIKTVWALVLDQTMHMIYQHELECHAQCFDCCCLGQHHIQNSNPPKKCLSIFLLQCLFDNFWTVKPLAIKLCMLVHDDDPKYCIKVLNAISMAKITVRLNSLY